MSIRNSFEFNCKVCGLNNIDIFNETDTCIICTRLEKLEQSLNAKNGEKCQHEIKRNDCICAKCGACMDICGEGKSSTAGDLKWCNECKSIRRGDHPHNVSSNKISEDEIANILFDTDNPSPALMAQRFCGSNLSVQSNEVKARYLKLAHAIAERITK